jgi:hypothetical protein
MRSIIPEANLSDKQVLAIFNSIILCNLRANRESFTSKIGLNQAGYRFELTTACAAELTQPIEAEHAGHHVE